MSVTESNCQRETKQDKNSKCFNGSGSTEGDVDISESRFSEAVKPETRLSG